MLRNGDATAPVMFETPEGTLTAVGGHGAPGTRFCFPQVASNLSQRWCSPVAKIDVMRAMICNSPRLLGKRILVVTGECAQESPARARYLEFEPHRTDMGPRPRTRRELSALSQTRPTDDRL